METLVVVDDDPIFCGLLKTVLEFEDYHVIVEPNPDIVLSKVREVNPVLLLMDVHSEKGDTLDVLRELRADESLPGLRVVMTSGMDRSAECQQAGADAFLLKPFRPDELVGLIADLVAKSQDDRVVHINRMR
ncbi:MAG TPA: response regulator [Chloroflexi bacterium]|nr:response regulator [Chloroflexota bacterium]